MPDSAKIVRWRCASKGCRKMNSTSLLGDDSRRYCKFCGEIAFVRRCSICDSVFSRQVDILDICQKIKCRKAYREKMGLTKEEMDRRYIRLYNKKYHTKFRTATRNTGPVPFRGKCLSGSDLQHAKGDNFLRHLNEILAGKTPYVGFG